MTEKEIALYNEAYEEFCKASKKLLEQLEIAETLEVAQFYEVLKSTGAWEVIKKDLRHIGWIHLLENAMAAAYKVENH